VPVHLSCTPTDIWACETALSTFETRLDNTHREKIGAVTIFIDVTQCNVIVFVVSAVVVVGV
jgi:hypothetical protein